MTGRGALALSLLLLAGCEPTQVLVVFEAEPRVQARADTMRVRLITAEGDEVEVGSHPVGEGGVTFPTTVPVSPRGGDASRTFRVVGELWERRGGTERVFSRISSAIGFAEGRTVKLYLTFEDCCADLVDCGAGMTCREGLCVDERRCTDGSVCAEDETCVEGACMPPPPAPICGGETGCPDNEVCQLASGSCEPAAPGACGVPAEPGCSVCPEGTHCIKVEEDLTDAWQCVVACDPCAPSCRDGYRCVQDADARSYCVLDVAGMGETCNPPVRPCANELTCVGAGRPGGGTCWPTCVPDDPVASTDGQVKTAYPSRDCPLGSMCFVFRERLEGDSFYCRPPRDFDRIGQLRSGGDCLYPARGFSSSDEAGCTGSYCSIPCDGDAECPAGTYCATLQLRDDALCLAEGHAVCGVSCRDDEDCADVVCSGDECHRFSCDAGFCQSITR